MSRTITLTLVSAAMLTACVTSTVGCGRNRSAGRTTTTTDRTWYDAQGNRIAENWAFDDDGNFVPDPHPRDRNGNLWATDAGGNLVPPTYTTTTSSGTTSHRSSGSSVWIFGGNGYRGSGPTTYSVTSSGSRASGGFGRTGSSVSS